MRIRYMSVLILNVMLLVILSVSVYGSVYNIYYGQASPIRAETPKVILQQGTAGTSIIYTNGTSAMVNVASNWLIGWQWRKAHNITGSTVGAQANYQMKIVVINGTEADSGNTVYINNKTRSDFGDLRFTNSSGALLDYWIEEKYDGVNATFWVRIDSIPASPNNATIYVYYGKSDATTISNGTSTFEFFDDMESGESKWARTGLWHITEKKSYSSTHSFWYGREETNNYDTGAANSGELKTDQLGGIPSAKLECWYWREVESYPSPPYDMTVIYDSVDGSTWNQIWYKDCTYPSENAWTFLSINLSANAKHLRFFFDTVDSLYNNYWGWFIDDVRVRKYVDPEPSHGAWGNEENGQTFDYILKVTNQVGDAWKIRLRAYDQTNIERLFNCTIYFHNGGGISRQIYIYNGTYSQQFGNYYYLNGLSTIYIAMTVSATDTGNSRIYAYLEILVPNTSTYNLFIITFEIT